MQVTIRWAVVAAVCVFPATVQAQSTTWHDDSFTDSTGRTLRDRSGFAPDVVAIFQAISTVSEGAPGRRAASRTRRAQSAAGDVTFAKDIGIQQFKDDISLNEELFEREMEPVVGFTTVAAAEAQGETWRLIGFQFHGWRFSAGRWSCGWIPISGPFGEVFRIPAG